MELLYIAGIMMMAAIAIKIGYVVYKNLIKPKKHDNDVGSKRIDGFF